MDQGQRLNERRQCGKQNMLKLSTFVFLSFNRKRERKGDI